MNIQNIGFLAFPLFFLSFVSLAVILERLFFYIRLPKIAQCPGLEKMTTILQNNNHQPKLLRDELLSYILLQETKNYDFGLKILRLVAVISPMFGLLGTVIGIIKVFKTISLHDGPISPSLIADGLWNAMLTTALGLVVALPCLIAAFIFSRIKEKRVEAYQDRLNQISFQIEGVKL